MGIARGNIAFAYQQSYQRTLVAYLRKASSVNGLHRMAIEK